MASAFKLSALSQTVFSLVGQLRRAVSLAVMPSRLRVEYSFFASFRFGTSTKAKLVRSGPNKGLRFHAFVLVRSHTVRVRVRGFVLGVLFGMGDRSSVSWIRSMISDLRSNQNRATFDLLLL